MDKTIFKNALNEFTSIAESVIHDVMEQYETKECVNDDNVERIVKQMFVADWTAQHYSTESARNIYANLKTNPKEMLKSLRILRQMAQDETVLSLCIL